MRVLAVSGGERCALPGSGDGDVDVMGCGAVEGCDDEVVVDDLSGGERVGQGLIEGVAPGPGGGVESVGAIGAGQGGGRLEMVLDGEGIGLDSSDVEVGYAGGCLGKA